MNMAIERAGKLYKDRVAEREQAERRRKREKEINKQLARENVNEHMLKIDNIKESMTQLPQLPVKLQIFPNNKKLKKSKSKRGLKRKLDNTLANGKTNDKVQNNNPKHFSEWTEKVESFFKTTKSGDTIPKESIRKNEVYRQNGSRKDASMLAVRLPTFIKSNTVAVVSLSQHIEPIGSLQLCIGRIRFGNTQEFMVGMNQKDITHPIEKKILNRPTSANLDGPMLPLTVPISKPGKDLEAPCISLRICSVPPLTSKEKKELISIVKALKAGEVENMIRLTQDRNPFANTTHMQRAHKYVSEFSDLTADWEWNESLGLFIYKRFSSKETSLSYVGISGRVRIITCSGDTDGSETTILHEE